jgi:hypothetical protein
VIVDHRLESKTHPDAIGRATISSAEKKKGAGTRPGAQKHSEMAAAKRPEIQPQCNEANTCHLVSNPLPHKL